METQALLFAHRNMSKAYYEEENYITTSSGKETKEMKKFVGMILTMVISLSILVGAIAESSVTYLSQFPMTNDVKNAVEKGKNIDDNLYYYDAAIYIVDGCLMISDIVGFIPDHTWEIEQSFEEALEKCGLITPEVNIWRIGEVNGKQIYRIEIKTMTNLNDKTFGNNSYIGENMNYNYVVCIGTIN